MRMQILTTNQWSWWWVSTQQERQLLSGKNQNLHYTCIFKTADLCMYWLLNVLHWCVVGNNVGNGGLDLLGFRYLIEQDFPGSRVGPEPTTDCFSALMYGDVEGIIPGNALTVDPKKPFRNLDPFGNAFLNRWLKSTDRSGKEERGRWRESETKGN